MVPNLRKNGQNWGPGGHFSAPIFFKKNLYNEVVPILECFSANQFLIGPEPGQAQTLKVLNNFLSATALAASCEALHFGQTQGLDLQKMCDVINVSTGMNTATLDKITH